MLRGSTYWLRIAGILAMLGWKKEKRVFSSIQPALATGILNEHWRNGLEIENLHAGSIYVPRPLTQRRLTIAQEAVLMWETAELFVLTMRALYNVVTKPSL